MTPEKQVDVRCMCLSFAVSMCLSAGNKPPETAIEAAKLFENYILGTRAKLKVVSNDGVA
ncbi:MAG: hypothetical protein WCD70_14845 [Alphaproteobacteria bacterium]